MDVVPCSSNGTEARVIELTFDWALCEPDRDIFPQDLCLDERVVFHGTSSANEAAIEATGFAWRNATVSAGALQRLKAAYDRIGWMGDAKAATLPSPRSAWVMT